MEKIEMVLIDSDVLLDYLAARPGFGEAARSLFKTLFAKKIKLRITSVIAANTHYLLSKKITRRSSQQAISNLLNRIQCVETKHSAVEMAFSGKCIDEEDAIQYFTAIEHGSIDCICSRNGSDFPKGKIPVLTPKELSFRLSF